VSGTSQARPGRLVGRLLALAGLLLGLGVTGLAGAETATAAACSSSSGITVVVDYGSLGGTSVGCARSTGSGLDVLKAAGHAVTFVSPRQPGFVCTIDRRPDPCNGAPSSAYWSYWHAAPGGTWSYSTSGAASTHPKAGTVEGWAFGAGKPPAMRPPSAPRPATSSATRTSASRPASTSTSSGRGSTAVVSPSPRTTASTSATASVTSAASTDPASAAPSPSDGSTPEVLSATHTVRAESTSAASRSAGAGTVVVAVLLVLLLAGGGGLLAWRRRGRDA
jgi:hypothetical protein